MLSLPRNDSQLAADYMLVAKAIAFLEEHQHLQPDLKEVAASVGLSEFHFQRLFSRWVGISPKRFLQFLTVEHAKQALRTSHNVLLAAYQAGLSGPGRLHDLFVSCEAMTPGEYRRRGEGVDIRYAFQPTPFGEALVAMTQKGICNLQFVDGDEQQAAIQRLYRAWPKANLCEDATSISPIVYAIFSDFPLQPGIPIKLHLRGTNFQIKVWQALLNIPAGKVVSYQDIAICIGMPDSARAVGQAIARNPVAVIIPCHRVLPKSGSFGGYRWGRVRKKALLAWEASRMERDNASPSA